MKCPKCNKFNLITFVDGDLTIARYNLDIIKDVLLLENIILAAIHNNVNPGELVDWSTDNVGVTLIPNKIDETLEIKCALCAYSSTDPCDFFNSNVKEYVDWWIDISEMTEALE